MMKQKYIQEEDYDGAQTCKTEVEDIKLSLIHELESYGLRIDQNGVIYSARVDVKDSGLELAQSNIGSKISSLNSISCSLDSVSANAPSLSSKGAQAQSPRENQHIEIPNDVNVEPASVPDLNVPSSKPESIDANLLSPQKNTVVIRSGSPLLPAQQKMLEEGKLDKDITAQPPLELKVKPVITRTGSPMLPAQQKLLEGKGKPNSPNESESMPQITRTGSPMLPAQKVLLSKKERNPGEEKKVLGDNANGTPALISNSKNAPNGLAEPEALSASQLEKFSTCIDVFQLFVVEHTLSMNFKCREYGLAEISTKIAEWKKNGQGSDITLTLLVQAATQLAGYCLEDSREKTSLLTLAVLNQLLGKMLIKSIEMASKENEGQIYNSFANLVNSLIIKAGDTNPRIKSVIY